MESMPSRADSGPGQPHAAAVRSSVGREVLMLRIFMYMVYTTQALVVSYFPLYFLDKGYSASQIGIIYSIGPFISIFANILFGTASDRLRTIKKIMSVLMFGQLVTVALLYSTDAFLIVCIIMLAFYFFYTPVNPLSDSLILLSSQYTSKPYALVRIFGSLGFALSAFLIGHLLKVTGTGSTITLAVVSVGITLLLSFTLKDYQGASRKIEFAGFFNLIRKPSIIVYFAIILVVSISHRMYEGFLAVTMRDLGASDSLVGLAWLMSAISEIPVLFLLGKYGHKFKELPLLAVASLLYALRFWLVSEVESPVWIIPIQAMHSVTFGIYFVTALRYLTSIIPDEYRSSGQAVYAVIWSGFAGVISGTGGGAVYQAFGRAAFFRTAMVLALIASAAFLIKHFASRDQ